jgi:hypothetical protein
MKKNETNSIKFIFDKDRGSSLVLIINKETTDEFDPSKFLKKYYSINTIKDEGETQSYIYLDSLKTIKKKKGKFSFGFDFVKIKASGISEIIEELYLKNMGEIWITINEKFQCVADFNSQEEEEIKISLSQILGENKIDLDGIIFEVVGF